VSVASLLTQELTISRPTEGAADAYGNPTSTWAEVATVLGRLEQRSSQERTDDQDTVSSDWVAFLPPETVVYATDRITDEYARTFEIAGAPAMVSAPRRDIYVEVSLRYVEGF
jgi:head-tail adaptor